MALEDSIVTVDELLQFTKVLLEELRERRGDILEFSVDYYWNIFEPKLLYNPYEKPNDLLLGQLTFDVDALRSSLKDDSMVPMYLRKLGHLMIALSDDENFTSIK